MEEYHVTFREAERDIVKYIGLLRKQLDGSPEQNAHDILNIN